MTRRMTPKDGKQSRRACTGQAMTEFVITATLFLIPIVLFTIMLRQHLLRGITFGAVRK